MAKWDNKMGDGEKMGGNISAFIFVLGESPKVTDQEIKSYYVLVDQVLTLVEASI